MQYKFRETTEDNKNVRMTDTDVIRNAKKAGIPAKEYVNQFLDEVDEPYYSIMEWKGTHIPIALQWTRDLEEAKAGARAQYGDYDTVYRAYVAFADPWDAGEHIEVVTDIWEGREPDKRWTEVYGMGVRD